MPDRVGRSVKIVSGSQIEKYRFDVCAIRSVRGYSLSSGLASCKVKLDPKYSFLKFSLNLQYPSVVLVITDIRMDGIIQKVYIPSRAVS